MAKKGSSKKGSNKKAAANLQDVTAASRRDALIPGDPPIIVGGGGSTLVWIKNNIFDRELTADEVTALLTAHPNIPQPTHPDNYHVFRCNVNIGRATMNEDNGPHSVRHNGLDVDRHHTRFND